MEINVIDSIECSREEILFNVCNSNTSRRPLIRSAAL
jgi:hypothetical protein